MSRLGVRNAIASYLNGAQITCVGDVKYARDYINEQDYEQRNLNGAVSLVTTPAGSGCVLIVNLTAEQRERRALTGRGQVNDTNIHTVVLEVFFANVGGTPVNAQEDYDAVIDGIFESVRADPTLGTGGQAPGSVWSAGEYQPWITHDQSAPYTSGDGMTVFIVGVVRFQAWEWIAGAGV